MLFQKAIINCKECYNERSKGEGCDLERAFGLQNEAITFLQRGIASIREDRNYAETFDFNLFHFAGDMCERCDYSDAKMVEPIREGVSILRQMQV